VVDDDDAMRRLASSILSRHHRVLEADGVAAALAVMAIEDVDLVVMDVMMPGVSGLDGCRALKAFAKGFLPILLLTALGEPDDVIAGLEAGADDFLTKPVNRRELELRVAAFLTIRRQGQEIARQLAELRHLSTLKDDLVGVLVHDLRNPLSAVMSCFSLLGKSVTDAESQEDVRLGLDATRRVVELADDLLMVRLLEEGKLTPTFVLGKPVAVVTEALDTLRPMARERHVELRLHERGDIQLPLDRKLLRRAVENLVTNAVKYTRETVEVSVTPAGASAEVTVADRGPGIPDAYKPSMFEKYGSVEARSGNTRRGIGLGLYMVRLVAAVHHGAVTVEDRAGGGTVFRLRLGPQT
jgi:signal transduction histidine kinase